MLVFFDSAKIEAKGEQLDAAVRRGVTVRASYLETEVHLTTEAFDVEKSLIDVLLVNGKSVAGRAQSKGITSNVARARGAVGRAQTKGQGELRQYVPKPMRFAASPVETIEELFDVGILSPLLIGARSVAGRAGTAGRVDQKRAITGGGAVGRAITNADVFVPFALRHRGAVGRAQSEGYVFIPPYQLIAKSVAGRARSKAFVKTPYIANARGAVGRARSKASIALLSDALHLFRPTEGTAPFVNIQREKTTLDGFTTGVNLGSTPTGGGYGEVKYSPDGKFAVLTGLSNTDPRPFVYRRQGNNYTAIGALPGGNLNAANVAGWSRDSKYLFIGIGAAPWIVVYRREANDTFTRLTDVGAISAQAANGIAASPRNDLIAFTYSSASSLAVYRFSGEKFIPVAAPGVYLPNKNCQSPVWHPSKDNVLFFMAYRMGTALGSPVTVQVESIKVAADLQTLSLHSMKSGDIDSQAAGAYQLFLDAQGKDMFVSTRRHRASGMGSPPPNDTMRLYAVNIDAMSITLVNAAPMVGRASNDMIEWLSRSDDGRYVAQSGWKAAGRMFTLWRRATPTTYVLVSETPLPTYSGLNPVVSKAGFSAQKIRYLEDASVRGELNFPALEMSGTLRAPLTINARGVVGRAVTKARLNLVEAGELSGSFDFPSLELEGELLASIDTIEGTLTFAELTLEGTLAPPDGLGGTFTFEPFELEGVLSPVDSIRGTFSFEGIEMHGLLREVETLEGDLTFPTMTLFGRLMPPREGGSQPAGIGMTDFDQLSFIRFDDDMIRIG